ncbi:MAG TPA: ethanolamine utilization protein EutJ [Clostridia bacterium]|jgi:ethanolamine utilization protein EutJ|nr:ethanolamine utilization protein EutJ [Clostridia bacterium]
MIGTVHQIVEYSANHLEEANGLINILAGCISPQPALVTEGPIFIGVDVGTANVVSVAVDRDGVPLAGEITRARVVKEGIIVNYFEAVHIVQSHIESLSRRLGRKPDIGASAIPPGTEMGNIKVTRNILEAAGLEVKKIVDEPTAASLVLGFRDGVVVDVGGGTTGISILENGKVIYTGDEPTGGFQFDLVIAGHYKTSIEEAEMMKCDPECQRMLFPIVRPVIEKIATIIRRHLAGYQAKGLYFVGGTCSFPGFIRLIEQELGIPTYLPNMPMMVTPLGIALSCREG